MTRRRLPELISENVNRELRRLGSGGPIQGVAEAWPASVGAEIARNAWPLRLARDGTLHVATSSSTWAFELTQREELILVRLRETLGEQAPARARFSVGPLPEHGRDEDVSKSHHFAPEVLKSHRQEAARITSEVGDFELREAISRAIAASLSSRR